MLILLVQLKSPLPYGTNHTDLILEAKLVLYFCMSIALEGEYKHYWFGVVLYA